MGTRLLTGATILATVISAVVLGVLLAAPFLPQPAAALPAASTTPAGSEMPSEAPGEVPPLGLYRLRGPYAVGIGPCFGLELTPPSYPIGESAGPGVATLVWWERGRIGCDTRTGEIQEVEVSVERLPREDAPDETAGYVLRFELPELPEVGGQVELTILAARSTQDVLQVVDTGGGDTSGLVFDRVEAIEPPLDPLPSPTPVALAPIGLYLLEGPLAVEGPCLLVEFGEASYPDDVGAAGSALVRWWDRAVPDPEDPAACLSRSGDVEPAVASVVAITDSTGAPIRYLVTFSLPASGTRNAQSVEIGVDLEHSTEDELRATVAGDGDGRSVVLDRVDSFDPPLGSPAP